MAVREIGVVTFSALVVIGFRESYLADAVMVGAAAVAGFAADNRSGDVPRPFRRQPVPIAKLVVTSLAGFIGEIGVIWEPRVIQPEVNLYEANVIPRFVVSMLAGHPLICLSDMTSGADVETDRRDVLRRRSPWSFSRFLVVHTLRATDKYHECAGETDN